MRFTRTFSTKTVLSIIEDFTAIQMFDYVDRKMNILRVYNKEVIEFILSNIGHESI